jgi:hypothetical protein
MKSLRTRRNEETPPMDCPKRVPEKELVPNREFFETIYTNRLIVSEGPVAFQFGNSGVS